MENIKYHYTSLDGLLSILSYKTLRFGNVNMMNDPTELKIGEMFLFNFIKDRYKTNHFDSKTINSVINSHYNRGTYIFCMSEIVEDLNQWRVYGDNGVGVQLSINVDNLQSYVNKYLDDSMGAESKKTLSTPYVSDGVKKSIYLTKASDSAIFTGNDNPFKCDFLDTEASRDLSKYLTEKWNNLSLDDYFEVVFHDGYEILVTKNIAHQMRDEPIDSKTSMRGIECLCNIEKISMELKSIVKDESYKVENEHRCIIYTDKGSLPISNVNEFDSEGIYIKDIFSYYSNSYGLSSCIDIPIHGNENIGNVITDIRIGCNSNDGNLKTIEDILKYKWGYLNYNIPKISKSNLNFR